MPSDFQDTKKLKKKKKSSNSWRQKKKASSVSLLTLNESILRNHGLQNESALSLAESLQQDRCLHPLLTPHRLTSLLILLQSIWHRAARTIFLKICNHPPSLAKWVACNRRVSSSKKDYPNIGRVVICHFYLLGVLSFGKSPVLHHEGCWERHRISWVESLPDESQTLEWGTEG